MRRIRAFWRTYRPTPALWGTGPIGWRVRRLFRSVFQESA